MDYVDPHPEPELLRRTRGRVWSVTPGSYENWCQSSLPASQSLGVLRRTESRTPNRVVPCESPRPVRPGTKPRVWTTLPVPVWTSGDRHPRSEGQNVTRTYPEVAEGGGEPLLQCKPTFNRI